jgi:hypothetical protein
MEAESLGWRSAVEEVRKMEENYFGFDMGKLLLGTIRLLKQKGLLEESAVLDLLWEAKEPSFPWSKSDIKELVKL